MDKKKMFNPNIFFNHSSFNIRSPRQQDDVKQPQQQFIVTLGEPVLSVRKKKKSAVPEWMKWDEKKKKEEQEKKDKEAAEKEDGGFIQLEPKQQVRHGRRQMAN